MNTNSPYEDEADRILAFLYEMGGKAPMTDLKVRTKLLREPFYDNLEILRDEGFILIKESYKKSATIIEAVY